MPYAQNLNLTPSTQQYYTTSYAVTTTIPYATETPVVPTGPPIIISSAEPHELYTTQSLPKSDGEQPGM